MVHSLESINDEGTECETSIVIKEDNLLLEGEYFSESGIIEHMAQSVALKAGYFFVQAKQEVPIGYIGKIAKLKISDRPKVGEELRTEIVETMKFGMATVVDAKTYLNGKMIAEGQLNVYTQ